MPTQSLVPGLGQFPAFISLSALNGNNGFRLDGVTAGENSGYSVSAAGDVNNDGIADILIGAHHANSEAGKTYVVFGKAGSWTTPISLSTLNGTGGFRLDGMLEKDARGYIISVDTSGYSVSAAGDVNNDGIADIIIGAPSANSYAGKTYVVFGKAGNWTSPISLSTLNGTNGFALESVVMESSGNSVSSAGDINNDGITDIIIGASGANSTTGKTYVVFGKASGWSTPISLSTLNGADGFQLDGVSANDYSGYSVSAAGDINGDGIGDILIGAYGTSPGAGIYNVGQTYVIFGKASAWTTPISLSTLNGTSGFRLDGVSAYDYSGRSVNAAGDVNNDGIADILIGAYYANSGAGKTYVVFGKSSGWTSPISLSALNGANGFSLNGVAGDYSGRSVNAAGDVNNDGIADIIIGAYRANSEAGKTYVVFGKASGWASSISLSTLNGTNGFALNGVYIGEVVGFSVSSAGDVNNDGIADIIMGGYNAGSQSGRTYVVFGDSPPVLASNALVIGAGCAVTLNSTYLAAHDLNHANGTLTFTASNVTNGKFQKTVSGVVTPLTTPIFLQSDITAGYIQFVSTNSSVPSYSMTVSSPGLAFVPATPAVVSFTAPFCSQAPTQVSTTEPTAAPTAGPTFAPSGEALTQVPSIASSTVSTRSPSAVPSFAPSAASSTQAPASSVVSSASRTSPAWFLPISQAVSLLDSTLPAAYQSVSGYLSGSDASSQSDTHNASYTSPSLATVGAQLMLGAVALKLAQKGVNWAKGFWATKPALKSNAAPALPEAAQSVQTKGSEPVSHSTTKDVTAEMKHLSEKMETYQACLEEAAAQSNNVVYPDFQKPGISFAYKADARKRTPSSAEQAVFTNSNRLATLGR
jgi:hypothetical protein